MGFRQIDHWRENEKFNHLFNQWTIRWLNGICDKYSLSRKLIRKCSSLLPHDVLMPQYFVWKNLISEMGNWNKTIFVILRYLLGNVFHFEINRTTPNVTIRYYYPNERIQLNTLGFLLYDYCSHELTMFAKIIGKSRAHTNPCNCWWNNKPCQLPAPLPEKNKIITFCNCLVFHDLFSAAASEHIRLNLLMKMVDQTTHFPHILFYHWSSSLCIVSIE